MGITSKCNAQCDYCNRQTFPGWEYINQDMTLDTFKKIYKYTDHIEFCGSFGDFSNHSNGLEFVDLSKTRPDLTFNIETNGETRTNDYWVELARMCNSEKSYVQFSIDDIEREINPYRKVRTQTVLRNLNTFIEAGGYAVVKTLLFRFNQDQPFNQYFSNIGVKRHIKQYSMCYSEELPPPDTYRNKKGTLDYLYSLGKNIKGAPKKCPWSNGKWIYILDNGEVHPCCNFVVFGAELEDKMPFDLPKYTDRDKYGEVYDLYINNRELIDLSNPDVTLESAYYNEYNVYVRNNFKTIPRCINRCNILNVLKNPPTGTL